MLPQEVRTLSPNKCIILTPGLRPLLADRIIYYKDKTFTKLLLKAPVVASITPAKKTAAIPSVAPNTPDTPVDHALSVAEAKKTGGQPRTGNRGTRAPVGDALAAVPSTSNSGSLVKPAPALRKTAGPRTRKKPAMATTAGDDVPMPLSGDLPSAGQEKATPESTPLPIEPQAMEPTDRPVLSPARLAIWEVISASEPDMAKYGLSESQRLMSGIVRQLPGELAEPGRAMAVGDD